jgi:hypothetical protein
LFDRVALAGPVELAEQVRAFGERTDVRPEAFAFAFDRDDGGPFYRGTTSLEDVQDALRKLREAGFLEDAS